MKPGAGLKNFHNDLRLEREAYYVRRAQAETRPKQVLSLILDGMDQKKTNLPHYTNWTNPDGAGTVKLRTHVMGGIAHGREKYFFIDYNQYPHDTNLVLSCLLRILKRMSNENTTRLPSSLYVQLDNTSRENKNKYFLGMAAYLVKKGYVKEVWISFLIVGHTHEDVEQTFSKISHRLEKNSAFTLAQLRKQIEESQQQSSSRGQSMPIVENLDHVWNISGWLEGYINQVHNVTYPHIYRITDDGTGRVQIQFKHFSTDDMWRPQISEKHLDIFKINPSGQQMIPEGVPDLVEASFKDESFIQALERSLEKDYKLAAFTTETVNVWKQFLRDPLPEPHEKPIWPLNEIGPYLELQMTPTLSEKEQNLIAKFAEKQHQYKEVYTAQRRRTT